MIEEVREMRREALALLRTTVAEGQDFTGLATGYSMLPLIREGAKIRISKVDPKKMRRGQLFATKVRARIAVHRLVRIVKPSEDPKAWKFILKGDANQYEDQPVGLEEIFGTARLLDQTVWERFIWNLRNMRYIIFNVWNCRIH